MSKKMEKQYTKANKDLEYSAEEINTRVQERAQDAINLASGLTGTIDTSKQKAEGVLKTVEESEMSFELLMNELKDKANALKTSVSSTQMKAAIKKALGTIKSTVDTKYVDALSQVEAALEAKEKEIANAERRVTSSVDSARERSDQVLSDVKERYDGMIDKTNNEFMLLGKKIEGLPANERQWTQKLQGSITAISGDAQAFADLVGKSELEQQ